MKRTLKLISVVAVLGIVAAACGGNNGGNAASNSQSPGTDLSGGTLRMAMLGDVSAAFDPQKEYYSVSWEYLRCCLLRNLQSYKGVPTADAMSASTPSILSRFRYDSLPGTLPFPGACLILRP